MIYNIHHTTRFIYQHWIGFSHNLVRLQPRETALQSLIHFDLSVSPAVAEMDGFTDFFGNRVHHLLVREPHIELKVTASSRVRIDLEALLRREEQRRQATGLLLGEALERMDSLSAEVLEAKPYTLRSPLLQHASAAISEYARLSLRPERSLYEGITELMERMFTDFSFVSGFTDITTPVETVFREKKGVCQDFAHFAITALRSLGLAVRYMSGYIETDPPEGEEKLFGVDASHAWISVFFPGYGWFEFDPTNNIAPYDRHLLLGFGRDYSDVAPMQGVVIGSGSSHLEVMVDVRQDKETEQE